MAMRRCTSLALCVVEKVQRARRCKRDDGAAKAVLATAAATALRVGNLPFRSGQGL